MSYRKSLLTLAFAALAFGLTQAAYAVCPLSCPSTYDSTSKTKTAPDTDLVCEGNTQIQVGGLPGQGPLGFEIKSQPGGLSCWEVSKSTGATVAGPAPFTLSQVTVSPTDQLDVGLVLQEGLENGKKTWTWKFIVDGTNQTKEKGLWKLTPANGNPDFCGDVSAADCTSWQGTPSNASVVDFPNGLFSFTMIEDNGQLIAKEFKSDWCHNGTFDGSLKNNGDLTNPIVCEGSGQQRGLKFRTEATATVVIALDVDIEPGQDPNLLNRASTGYLTVALLSRKEGPDIAVNPATFDAANVTLDGVKASGASDLNSDYNADGVNDLTVRYSIQNDLLADSPGGSSLLKNAAPGDVTVAIRAPSTVGNTVFTGSGVVTIVQPVRADYRPGCGNQVSLNNPSGSDPVALLGGSVGAFDTVDVTKIRTQNTTPAGTVKLGGVTLTTPQIGDVSGTDCGTTTADGNPDGTADLQLTVDVKALYLQNKALFDSVADGAQVSLPVTGQLLNGASIVGTATVTVQKK